MIAKFYSVIKISRPVNAVITFATIILAGIICSNHILISKDLLLAAVSGMFVLSGGNIINDYFDIETDKINRPERVLPEGGLTKNQALTIYFLFSIFSLISAVQINLTATIIVILTIVLLFLYSFTLKKIPLVGNLLISALTGLAFIFGGVAVNNWKAGLFPALFALLINFIREIIKDTEDVEGDKLTNVVTFPLKYGFNKTVKLIGFLILLLIIATSLPFFFHIYNIEYFIIVTITVNLILVYSFSLIFKKGEKANLRKISNLLKVGMLFGLFAIFAGSNKLF